MPLKQATDVQKDLFVRNTVNEGKYFFARKTDTGEIQFWYRDLKPEELASIAKEIGKVVTRRRNRGATY